MGSTSINFGTRDSRPANSGMQSFISHTQISNPMIAGSNTGLNTRISDFGALEQYLGIQMRDPGNISRDTAFNVPVNGQSAPHQYSNLDKNLASTATDFQGSLLGTHAAHSLYRPIANVVSSAAAAGVQHENWGESNMGAESSSRTDTSTDIDHDDKNQNFEMEHVNASDSSDKTKEKALDQKTLRRLAQNREAARKSRLRKKAYVQQLENSRLKLTQIEQELQRARQQGVFISSVRDQSNSGSMNGASVFDAEYARWLEEQTKHINDLRTAVNIHAVDTELRPLVDIAAAHFYGIFRLKATAVKTDVFHILSGMWKTPAERCFMWIGGFRPSEILKLSMKQLEPLSEPQLNGLYNLQQSSHQAEDALSQGMDALQQTLAESLASGSCGTEGFSSGTVGNYMGQMAMAMAMAKLENLEGFLRQADGLRQQTLQQMHRILTTRQSARALLLINDYLSKLRALSSLWLARPRE